MVISSAEFKFVSYKTNDNGPQLFIDLSVGMKYFE